MGIQPAYGIIPNVMYYHLGGKKSRFEIGCGLSFIIDIIETEDSPEDFKGLMVHGVMGYRYQKKNGLLFRASFTPLYVHNIFLPMIGISFGYSL